LTFFVSRHIHHGQSMPRMPEIHGKEKAKIPTLETNQSRSSIPTIRTQLYWINNT